MKFIDGCECVWAEQLTHNGHNYKQIVFPNVQTILLFVLYLKIVQFC